MFENINNQWVEVEIKPEPQMFYVVAGDYRQARDWAKRHGVAPVYWKFVNTPEDLFGAEGHVVYWGSFYVKANHQEIKAEIQAGIQKGRLKELGNDE